MSTKPSSIKVTKGVLLEYTSSEDPLVLTFDFNPSSITRSRSLTLKPPKKGKYTAYDFDGKKELPRASQGVTVNPEKLTVKILLDATDRMNDGDADASSKGVQPEIDTLRSMLEPKLQGSGGKRTLAALGQGKAKAIAKDQYASVLEFKWGTQSMPVFMTQVQIDIKAFLPNLIPYRAEATLTLEVIASRNPLYKEELQRQFDSAYKQKKKDTPAGAAS